MSKRDFDISELFNLRLRRNYNSFQDTKFQESLLNENEDKQKFNFYTRTKRLGKKIWDTPESRVILLLVLSRIFFIIFTSWGIDFDFYVENSVRFLAGEKLYTDIDTTHMPLVDFIYIVMYALCPWKSNLYAVRVFLKFPFLLTDIGITLGIMKIIENEFTRVYDSKEIMKELPNEKIRKVKLTAGYFVAFSIPLIFQTGGGRYDSLMIFCFVMVIFCLQKNNWFGIAFFAALGTSTKYIGLIFIPFVFFWMKKENIIPFILGLLLGLVPIYPFLFTIPKEFLGDLFVRDSHIAYGFSIWHLVYIVWNKFNLKYVGGIEDTYLSDDEPWFVKELYIPMFVVIFSVMFVLYIIKYWKTMRTETINTMPLSMQISLVFIPLFIFALSFKAINIQVLAWFTPFCALRRKKGLLIEYTFLTIIHGLALILFEATNEELFLMMSENAATNDSPFYHLVVIPALHIVEVVPVVVWVSIIVCTIIWFFIRTSVEFILSSKELLTKNHVDITL